MRDAFGRLDRASQKGERTDMRISTTVLVALVFFSTGCSKQVTATSAGQASKPAVAAAVTQATTAPAAAANQVAGKVLETFNGGGYTYARVGTPSGEQWAAVRETKMAVGDSVVIVAQMTMQKFESKTLNRTFDTIVFGEMAGAGAAAAASAPSTMPAGHPATPGAMPPQMTSAMGSPSQHMKSPDLVDVNVEKAEGGKTVAELWSGKSALKGKDVVVRGKVVKFLAGIMGTNWIHLQDGSGSDEKGDNDITVTTDDKAIVGDVVTVKGTLTADKDFGAGYRYAVIIEKAKVTK